MDQRKQQCHPADPWTVKSSRILVCLEVVAVLKHSYVGSVVAASAASAVSVQAISSETSAFAPAVIGICQFVRVDVVTKEFGANII